MANSTTNIDGIIPSQANKEATANAFFDAASQAATYGRRASTSSGLTWGYYGGNVVIADGSTSQIANGTLTLTPSSTNYIVAEQATGAVSVSTSDTNWNNTADYWRLYSVVTGSATVTSWTDVRAPAQYQGGGSGGGGGGTVDTIVAGDGILVDATDPANPEVSADFGTTSGTVCEGDDSRLSDSRDWNGTGIDDAAAGRAALSVRERLTADRTYYVRTDGSDSNNGLADTSGGAFLTLQKAVDTVATIDTGPYNVFIQMGNGTYDTASGTELKSIVGGGRVTIRGDTTTPSNVVLNTTGAMVNTQGIVGGAAVSGKWKIEGVKFTSSATGQVLGLFAGAGTYIEFGDVEFGTGITFHLRAGDGGSIVSTSGYTISAGALWHLYSGQGSSLRVATGTITLSGTPAFSSGFALATQCGVMVVSGVTFSGSATGARYSATLNGVINTNGAGETYLPGDSAGSTATGGQYA